MEGGGLDGGGGDDGVVLAVEAVGARGGGVQIPQNVHERALAGAGRAHDGDPFALFHLETYVVQGLELPIDLGNVFYLKQAPFYSPFKTSAGSMATARLMGARQLTVAISTETITAAGLLGALPAFLLCALAGPGTALGAAFRTMFLSFGNAFMFGGLLAALPSQESFDKFEKGLQSAKT